MRHLYFIVLLVCILPFYSFAQQESLEKLEDELKTTSQIGLQLPIYEKIIVRSFPDDIDRVKKYSDELLNLAISVNNLNYKAFASFYLGEALFEQGNYEESESYYKQSLEIYLATEEISKIIPIYHKLGLINQYINHYDESLSFYQKLIEEAESVSDLDNAARGYQDIGTLYNDLQKYSLAEHYYEKALAIYEKTNNEERKAAIYQNIGVLHYNWGDFTQSIEFYKKSLKIYELQGDKQNIAISLSNIGLVYEETKDFNTALDYYLKALIIFEEMDFKPTLVYIFYNLGSLYRNLEDYSKSIEYFNKGLKLSKEIPMNDYISYNYEALSGVYEEMEVYKEALINYKEFSLIKDSLFNEQKHQQIEELEAQFQTARQEKEIEFLKLNQELRDAKLKKKESQILFLIISASLAVLIAFILLIFARNQRNLTLKYKNEVEEKKETEKQLKKAREDLEIRIQERTKDLEKSNIKLLSEIEEHKKTTNNLQLAKNKAEEADKLKSNFLANISHEVRTPMNAISGFSQMLAFKNLTPSKRNDYINFIQDSCKSLTNLIDDIVDFASIESGDVSIEKKEFNPHPILEFLFDHYTKELVMRNKEHLILSYTNENSEIDLMLYTDPSRLKQILSILIDNAIKFTEQGHIEFGFEHINQSEIQFFVRDTGIGIDESKFDIIFERFRQLDDTTTKKYGGTGIGLSVAKSLTRLMGGEISIESTPGRGSSFFVTIPLGTEEKQDIIVKQPSDFHWDNKNILIAEDKKINFEIFQETLQATNAKLLWAKNGEETIEMVKENSHIDLILLDIQMPVMDGLECARIIKSMKKDIPIIAQTAYALPNDSKKCMEAGCDDYIAKPISMDEFFEKLNKYLS